MNDARRTNVKLWLTRLNPDARSRDVIADLNDARRLHKRIMSLFPDGQGSSPRAAMGVLYRVEHDTARGLRILVQSQHAPSGQRLPEGYGDLASPIILKGLLEKLELGISVNYRITGNPTKRAAGHDPKNPNGRLGRGDLVSLTGSRAEEWWERRAAVAGLQLHSLTARPLPELTSQSDRSQPLTIRAVQFDGTATITDPEAARVAVVDGIGRGRAFGCGLLSVLPHA